MKTYLVLFLTFIFAFSCGTRKTSQEEKSQAAPGKEISKVTLEELWSTDTVFRIPESVLYDPEREVIYVSNIVGDPGKVDGEGFISKLQPDGNIIELEWIKNLNAPKGMGVVKNFLYVADISKVVVIDIEESRVVEQYDIPGASFLNDISIGGEGWVYVSDSDQSKIYLIRNNEIETWMEGSQLNRPNGLYAENDQIMVASTGDQQVKKIQKESQIVSIIATEIGNGDGIVKDVLGNYVVSDWSGRIFYILPEGEKTLLLDTRDQHINSADIDLIVDENIVLVPTFLDNRIMAYQLTTE
jgi:DNA-binding beta-propeller fold protein YncE